MSLDPQCVELLAAIAKNGSPFDTEDPIESRRGVAAATKLAPDPDPRFDEVRDGTFRGPGGDIGYRFYRPSGLVAGPQPLLIYYHGGGMVFGSPDSHDVICRSSAVAADCLVISIDYRLAPEHPYPAAVMDARAAWTETVDQAAEFGADPARIAVGGDSAGGNLAAVVSLMALDSGGQQPCFQWLIYPNTDMTASGGSMDEHAEGYFLTRDAIDWLRRMYISPADRASDWRISPLHAPSHKGVAPALVQTAGYDPLQDEGLAYAKRLEGAGVPTEAIDYPGMIHGFIRAIGVVDTAQTAIDDGAKALRRAFGPD